MQQTYTHIRSSIRPIVFRDPIVRARQKFNLNFDSSKNRDGNNDFDLIEEFLDLPFGREKEEINLVTVKTSCSNWNRVTTMISDD